MNAITDSLATLPGPARAVAADLRVPADRRQSPAALAVATGVRRLLAAHGCASLCEMTLASGRRADVIALTAEGCVWIVEVKSSLADFRADGKWPDYRAYCDRFFFAVGRDFPTHVLPGEPGLILADQHGAEIMREAPEHRLAGSRRKAVMLRFAHLAAHRHYALVDPLGASGWRD